MAESCSSISDTVGDPSLVRVALWWGVARDTGTVNVGGLRRTGDIVA